MAVAAAMGVGWQAGAQFGPAPVVYENANLIEGDGSVREGAMFVVRGDRIVAVMAGDSAEQARGQRVDLGGAYVTAGLIDVTDVLANTASGGGDAAMRAADAFDHYAVDRIREALANGITAGFVPARGGGGVNGLGAIVRFTQNGAGSFGAMLVDESALCVNLASNGSAIQRLQVFDGVRSAFRGALDYRESFLAYEEELEEYEKKIKERAEKAESGKSGESDDDAKEDPAPAPAPGNGNGNGRGRGGRGGGDGGGGGGNSFQDEGGNRRGPANRGGGGNRGGQGGGNNEEEIKKPSKPSYNHAFETMLRAIDQELPVRVLADNSADVLNAIALAEEFDLDVIVEGGRESGLVAEALAEADMPIVLDYENSGGAREDNVERALDRNIRALDDAGVDWSFGSGRDAGVRGRFLLMHAQVAAQSAETSAIALLTADAADGLGVADEIGEIAAGRLADFVIWSAHPLDPNARPREVYVGGVRVFAADDDAEVEGQQ